MICVCVCVFVWREVVEHDYFAKREKYIMSWFVMGMERDDWDF